MKSLKEQLEDSSKDFWDTSLIPKEMFETEAKSFGDSPCCKAEIINGECNKCKANIFFAEPK